MIDTRLIFEKSQPGRKAAAQFIPCSTESSVIPAHLLRSKSLGLPSLSELDVIRHYTKLSQKNFSIDTHFYPLGSCTMKYNPRGVSKSVKYPNLLNRHPLAPEKNSQGFLQCLFELQEYLKDITGMTAVSLTPMAGSQGEFAGVAMMKRYHVERGDLIRDEIIIPDSAHGTNPASAAMCGCKVVEIPTLKDGDIDLEALAAKVGPRTVGIMLTNPSTTGTFSTRIQKVAALVHSAGGLLYYDGANLNAILGKVRPGDMGFDVIHLNLHKTFATPHGGGGPGAGPVATNARLAPFLPTPIVTETSEGYRWQTDQHIPNSIGRLSAFMGNAAILLRAHAYIRMLGRKGLTRVADHATLNANYLQCELAKLGYHLAYPKRRAAHEFLITLQKEKDETGVTAKDVGKRLLDYGIHAPTTYFPLLVPECLLIEPTETESKQTLDTFIAAMKSIRNEMLTDPELVKTAPHTLPVKRLDDVKAARELDLKYVVPTSEA